MSEYKMRLAVRSKIGDILYDNGIELDHIPKLLNRIEQILRDDIEMVDDEPAEPLEFHPPTTMGDR